MSFTEKFSNSLSKVAQAIENNKYLTSIKNAFTAYMPFIIVGSFASLFNIILCSETLGLAQVEMFNWLTTLSPAFNIINFATMSTMSLAITVLIGIELGRRNNQKTIFTGILALISFITIVPTSVTATIEELSTVVTGVLPSSSMNAQSLFVGMLIAIIAVEIYSWLSNIDKIKIKMPEQVPANIANSFNSLIPIMLTLLIVAIFGTVFLNLTGTYLSDFIYTVLQKPLEGVAQTPFGVIFLSLACALFWILGIHGSLVIMPLLSPLALSGLAANVAAVEAGKQATNVLTMTFFRVYVVCGGAGITISLILAIFLFSKRKDEKEIAKLGLFPGIFGINEPIIFGMPIILNPVYAIPFVLSQLSATIIAYVATVTGFIGCATVEVPFGLPLFVNAFVGLQSFQAIIVEAIVIAVAFIIYIPFVKISNKVYEKSFKAGE
ncbi:PTS transporter subunit EIIC [Thomasclavelia sp.]|uniref:PTS sugar transporter subunit IIC n=1 Tax=Thomasclavelia sp. TaxID=3025757 RepID=UPI0025FD3983|nr:PTS transporter subunit EIIC [Thomasclavelia sp.]